MGLFFYNCRYFSTDCDYCVCCVFPRDCIFSRVGEGAPPCFSMVMAKAWAFLVFFLFRITLLSEASKTPRSLGLPSISAHSWYCWSLGSFGMFFTTRYTLEEA